MLAIKYIAGMNTKDAIALAGSREELAKVLGVAAITTYRWNPDLPQHRADRLRILKPAWFRKKKEDQVPRQEVA